MKKKLKKIFLILELKKEQVIVFNFEKNGNIESFNQYNLNQEQQITFIKDKTKNDLVERGLIEKIFGGVGKTTIL